MPLSRTHLFYYLYVAGIAIMAVGLPFSRFLMSLSQFWLAAVWLAEGNFKEKVSRFFNNKIALSLVAIYLLHVAGLLWTTDFDYAVKDLRTKLPLLVLPIVLSSTPIFERKVFNAILLLFVSSATLVATYVAADYHGLFGTIYGDIRDAVSFDSHIRFGLMLCLSFFILLAYFRRENEDKKTFFLFWAVYLVLILFLIESATSLAILWLILIFWLIRRLFFRSSLLLKSFYVAMLLVLLILPTYLVFTEVQHYYSKKEYPAPLMGNRTPHGNFYHMDSTGVERENGYPVYQYLCVTELAQCWEKRFGKTFGEKDAKGNPIAGTLIRYMTSKGLKKDKDGFEQLTEEDFENIHKGITNHRHAGLFSINRRINEVIRETDRYFRFNNPNGGSVAQRLEYWKASLSIISKNPLIGVGTGDMNLAFEKCYNEMYSSLNSSLRRRSHNQFLSITVGFGVIGLLIFLAMYLYPWIYPKPKSAVYGYFFLIMTISMLTEDTIETQMGVTFFTFFTLFLTNKIPEPNRKSQN